MRARPRHRRVRLAQRRPLARAKLHRGRSAPRGYTLPPQCAAHVVLHNGRAGRAGDGGAGTAAATKCELGRCRLCWGGSDGARHCVNRTRGAGLQEAIIRSLAHVEAQLVGHALPRVSVGWSARATAKVIRGVAGAGTGTHGQQVVDSKRCEHTEHQRGPWQPSWSPSPHRQLPAPPNVGRPSFGLRCSTHGRQVRTVRLEQGVSMGKELLSSLAPPHCAKRRARNADLNRAASGA